MIILQVLALLLFAAVALVLVAAVMLRSVLQRSGLAKIFDLLRGQSSTRQQSSDRRAQRTTTPHGDTIIDRRDPAKANQKIFDRNEGEYVEYREE